MTGRMRRDRGSVLAVTMIILLVAAIVAAGLGTLATFQIRNTARYEIYKNEFEVAEAILAKVFSEIRFLVEYAGPNLKTDIQNIRAPAYTGYVVKNLAITELSDTNEAVTDGPQKGLTLHVIKYRVSARVHQDSRTSSRLKHPGVVLTQDLELRYIPLFLYAIFYNSDLEVHPGAYMEINGRVHTNAMFYNGSDGATLSFTDYVTAVRDILHSRHPNSGLGLRKGNDSFSNGTTAVSMEDTRGWIDHSRADWATLSQSRWNGYVRDSAQEVEEMVPPIPRLTDSQGNPNAHALIERANPTSPDEAPGTSLRQEKMEYKAGLKIVRDPATGTVRGYNQAGAAVPLTYPDPAAPTKTKSVYSESTFYDAREDKDVASIDINVANLIESGIAPENGILYLSNEGANGVVRITNASRLPTNVYSGFTIASDDPLYVKGDFNTTNKEFAMVAGDGITVLSNGWNDANGRNFSKRNVTETTFNGVFFQGIVPTQKVSNSPRYSGGVENYFRLLENWNNVNLRFNGSLISVWESQKARGLWKYGNPVYTAPKRMWAWDSMYNGVNGPPGAPRVYSVLRRNWNIHSLGAEL